MVTNGVPSVDWDMFSDEVLMDPYPHYRKLRDLGSVVYVEPYDVFAITRYDDVRRTLFDWRSFTNTKGVAFSKERNEALAGRGVLYADPPEHKHLRDIVMRWVSAKRMRGFRSRINEHARVLVGQLVERGSFDAVTDLAEALPAKVVGEMVGLPAEVRQNLIAWGEATFDAAGPWNERAQRTVPLAEQVYTVLAEIQKSDVDPDSTAYEILTLVEQGELDRTDALRVLVNLSAPSIDTTISGIATAVHQLALHPEAWGLLRSDPGVAPRVVEEALRFEAPAQAFTRVANEDCEVGGSPVPAGGRVAVYFASGNRDERHYADPDRFDVGRDAGDHLSFGHGVHHCVGAPLARIEIVAVLTALAEQVKTIEVGEPQRRINNVTRRLCGLAAQVTPA